MPKNKKEMIYVYPGMLGPQQIIRVNGEQGARSFRMLPNSSALLLDETAPLVWLAMTDGAGYMTVTPFEIKPYQPPPPPDYQSLLARIERLEGKYDQSNIAATTTTSTPANATEPANTAIWQSDGGYSSP